MIVSANGIEIYVEAEGPEDAEVLLLVPGQGQQAPDWDPEFLSAFTAAGYRVVRIDNRDSGESTFVDMPADLMALLRGDTSSVTYGLDDMADDALGVLDALGVERAHVLGHSMGAMIAQLVALAAPERVRTLTCIAGTTGATDVGQAHPGIAELFLARSQPGLTEEERLERSVAASSAWASFDLGVTEQSLRKRLRRRLERNRGEGGGNRQLAAVLTAPDRTERLRSLRVPTLVMHGDADPLVDVSGGRATANAVPGAKYVELPGVKHDIPPAVRERVTNTIIEHLSG